MVQQFVGLVQQSCVGNYAWLTIIHETGHLLGLKHPQDVHGFVRCGAGEYQDSAGILGDELSLVHRSFDNARAYERDVEFSAQR